MSRQSLDSVVMNLRPDFEKAYFDAAISGNAKPIINFANTHYDFFMNNYGIDVNKLFKIDSDLIKKIESFQLRPIANPFTQQEVPNEKEVEHAELFKYAGFGLVFIGLILLIKK